MTYPISRAHRQHLKAIASSGGKASAAKLTPKQRHERAVKAAGGKKRKEPWHLCYECGVKKYGKPSEIDMYGITVMTGTCPICKTRGVTLIPVADFIGQGD
jgi:hypothetical protein